MEEEIKTQKPKQPSQGYRAHGGWSGGVEHNINTI